MAKKINNRCPLQAECERKCAHEGHELDCDYYRNNAREGLTIEDQEAIREQQTRANEEALLEAELEEIPEGNSVEVQSGEYTSGAGSMVMLPISTLHPHPHNPRKELGDLTELADSIRAKGVFQNLTVVKGHYISEAEMAAISAEYQKNPTEKLRSDINRGWLPTEYTVIIGHRRRGAAEIAGLTHLPCVVVDMTQKEQLETMLLENMQREDLTPYEQAQGFQMMIDMGDTPEQIAEKTGFSKTTVRRRLKMAELDAATLREVSARQISMDDFDQLARIEDIRVRNECLKNIGTANFPFEVQKRIKKQNIAKNLPWVKNAIRLLKAKKITYTQTYYGDFSQIGEDIQIDELKGENLNAPDPGTKKLHYYLDEDSGRLRFYLEREKSAPVRRPQAEIDTEKAQLEANEKCAELSALFHKLRSEFVKKLTYGSRNQKEMLNGVIRAIITHGFHYVSVSSTSLFAIIGEERHWESGEEKRITDLLLTKPESTYPGIIYAAFCDKDNETYHTTYKKQWPRHSENSRLNALYSWLLSVGYIMSDEEKAMQDGTHELLHLGEKKDG